MSDICVGGNWECPKCGMNYTGQVHTPEDCRAQWEHRFGWMPNPPAHPDDAKPEPPTPAPFDVTAARVAFVQALRTYHLNDAEAVFRAACAHIEAVEAELAGLGPVEWEFFPPEQAVLYGQTQRRIRRVLDAPAQPVTTSIAFPRSWPEAEALEAAIADLAEKSKAVVMRIKAQPEAVDGEDLPGAFIAKMKARCEAVLPDVIIEKLQAKLDAANARVDESEGALPDQLLDVHAICDQRDVANARAYTAEARFAKAVALVEAGYREGWNDHRYNDDDDATEDSEWQTSTTRQALAGLEAEGTGVVAEQLKKDVAMPEANSKVCHCPVCAKDTWHIDDPGARVWHARDDGYKCLDCIDRIRKAETPPTEADTLRARVTALEAMVAEMLLAVESAYKQGFEACEHRNDNHAALGDLAVDWNASEFPQKVAAWRAMEGSGA